MENLQAAELRINNYLYNDGVVVKIDARTIFDIWDDKGLKNYKPIPLTEEWLLKFGFEKQHNEEDFDYWFKNDFSNDIIWEHSEGFCHNLNYGGDIKYVHQLQNLYFALTGEELIIIS